MEAMEKLVLGMRSRHARHAYVTSGLDKHGMLVDEAQLRRKAWIARPEWKSVLNGISEEHGENYYLVDIGLNEPMSLQAVELTEQRVLTPGLII